MIFQFFLNLDFMKIERDADDAVRRSIAKIVGLLHIRPGSEDAVSAEHQAERAAARDGERSVAAPAARTAAPRPARNDFPAVRTPRLSPPLVGGLPRPSPTTPSFLLRYHTALP